MFSNFVPLPDVWARHGRDRRDRVALHANGTPHRWGELVGAMERISAGLAGFARVVIVDDPLPRNALGKVLKATLRGRFGDSG